VGPEIIGFLSSQKICGKIALKAAELDDRTHFLHVIQDLRHLAKRAGIDPANLTYVSNRSTQTPPVDADQGAASQPLAQPRSAAGSRGGQCRRCPWDLREKCCRAVVATRIGCIAGHTGRHTV
jgi:hypothetical protein